MAERLRFWQRRQLRGSRISLRVRMPARFAQTSIYMGTHHAPGINTDLFARILITTLKAGARAGKKLISGTIARPEISRWADGEKGHQRVGRVCCVML